MTCGTRLQHWWQAEAFDRGCAGRDDNDNWLRQRHSTRYNKLMPTMARQVKTVRPAGSRVLTEHVSRVKMSAKGHRLELPQRHVLQRLQTVTSQHLQTMQGSQVVRLRAIAGQ